MEQRTNTILFALLRSAVCGTILTELEKAQYSEELLPELLEISRKHDVDHLVAVGLKNNGLVPANDAEIRKIILKAFLRYERLNAEYVNLCEALEAAKIPFIPLKGSVLRKYYPEEWMRTSCDIDVLVHREDLDAAVAYLVRELQYVEDVRSLHDVSLNSPNGVHVELHFDLVEEGLANEAARCLRTVWEDVSLRENSNYCCEMTDSFFYFYHIAHMAKHFELGGCGIRPLIDLWILDNLECVDYNARNTLLQKSGLLQFTCSVQKLSKVWLAGEPADPVSQAMQEYILTGGTYGALSNYVALQRKKKGGRIKYIWSRLFVTYVELKRCYPILEKHRWLCPLFQVVRWTNLLNPRLARKAINEIVINSKLQNDEANPIKTALKEIGL